MDASGISGFDFVDDARAAAAVDWDRDGRLDVWIRNRTGPQVRFLRNETETPHRFLALELRGVRVNRDAVGAVVELTAGGRRRVRQVSAGSGYLAQSSSTVHFGLGRADTIERLVVRWPGGETESIAPPAVAGRYRIVEGSGRADPVTAGALSLPASGPAAEPDIPATRLLLKTPLPLPPSLLRRLGADADRPSLVNLWAHWCEPCAEEVEAYAAAESMLKSNGIGWNAWSIDAREDRDAAATWWRRRFADAGRDDAPEPAFLDADGLDAISVVLEHVTGRSAELPIPASLLIDADGNLQMIWFGIVLPDRFLSDAGIALDRSVAPSRRSLHPGRWYYRSRRDYDALSRAMTAIGRDGEARFYRALADSR